MKRFEKFNPCQSSPSLTILVPLWFVIISLVSFPLSKLIFSGFFQFKRNYARGQNKSKYSDPAPVIKKSLCVFTLKNSEIRKQKNC